MTRIRPLKHRVLIKRTKAPEVTKSGIYLPTSAREVSGLADVLASASPLVQEGDLAVLPSAVDYRRFSLNGEDVELLDGDDILCAITIKRKEKKNGRSGR